MRSRALRIALWALLVLACLPVAAVLLLATGPGGRLLAEAVTSLSGGTARLHDLSIDLPGGIRAARIEVADAQGVWLTVEDAAISWSPAALFSRELLVHDLRADRVAVARLPAGGGSGSSEPTKLPGRVTVQALHVARLELAAPVAGAAAALAIDGAARLDSLEAGQMRLAIARQDAPGRYGLDASAEGGTITAKLDLEEPEGGLIAGIAGLPALGRLDAHATAEGPLAALAVQARLGAGELRATLAGVVDVPGQAARLDVTGSAPAMAPRADIAWKSAALEAHVDGPFAAPRGTARVRVEGLESGGVAVASIAADVAAGDGRMRATATFTGVAVPGVEALAEAPVVVTVEGPVAGPIAVTLRHPLVDITGTGAPDGTGDMRLTLPDLARLQGMTGLALAGSAGVAAKLRWQDNALTVDAAGMLGVTAAPEPTVALLGPRATFAAAGTLRGVDVQGGRFTLSGRTLNVQAAGDWKAGIASAEWHVALADLGALVPSLGGTLRIDGKTEGPADDLAVQADLAGDIAVAGAPATAATARLALRGLPLHPAGTLSVGGALDGAPVTLDATLAREADGTLRFALDRAGWKSGTGSARLLLRPGATLPEGQAALAVGALADAGHLLGLNLAGKLEATARLDAAQGELVLSLGGAGMPGVTARSVKLTATARDPMGTREVAAKLSVAGLEAGGMATNLDLDASGPPDRLALRLSGTSGLPGDPVRMSAGATLNTGDKILDLQQLQATWRSETATLAGPARVNFADGIALDRLRLGLRGAGLDVSGRVTPALDLTVALRDLPLELLRTVAPDTKVEGRIQGSARLTGNPAAPAGTVRLTGTGLRWRDGAGAALKPGSFAANATLAGTGAKLDIKAESGDTTLALAGTAPLGAGPIDLRITGRSGLAALDAVLAAGGRRLRGTVVLDATLTGTAAAPRAGGRLTLSGGDLQDNAFGVRLRNLAAELTGDGETIRLSRLTAQAGNGTVAAQGTFGLANGRPVRLELTMRQARLLASTLVTGTVDADLVLAGSLADGLAASGTLTLGRTDIGVPEHLPPGVAVLNVRRPGDKPPPPPPAPLPIGLDVTIKAPGQIFLRGRGIDAELQGELHLGGDAGAVRPSGAFTLRRGSFTLAGRTLNFVSGEVTLDGSLPIDPVLSFKASTIATGTAGTVIATVEIAGHASKPTVTLSSVPELPADEVLAQLLFNRSAAALGPLELAQIAAALAELTGVGPKVSPLETIRARLGLDRLSVGTGSNGAASVQAGRTIAPGVYLGAKETAGAGTKATVEVDLYKGLKLRADVGGGGGTTGATGASGSSSGTEVGVTYQFEY